MDKHFALILLAAMLASCNRPAQPPKQAFAQKPTQAQPPTNVVQPEPEFWGHRIGETVVEFYKAEKRKPPRSPKDIESFKTGKKDELGVDDLGDAWLSDGHLVLLDVLVFSEDYEDVVADMTTKVGAPSSTSAEVVQNEFGATWTVPVADWDLGPELEIKISHLRSFGATGADVTIGVPFWVSAYGKASSSGSHLFDN